MKEFLNKIRSAFVKLLKTVKSAFGKVAVRRHVYSIVLTVIFISAAVLLTALSIVLSARFPLQLDLTLDRVYSVTENNVDFLKSIERKVKIYICMPEELYSGENNSTYDMSYYSATRKFVDYNSENAAYFKQTVKLLNNYPRYNNNITVEYLDMDDPSSNTITDNYDVYGWERCDILVESTFVLDGKEVTRRTVVPFEDIYTLADTSGQTEQWAQAYFSGQIGCYALYGQKYGYMISENNLEQALSSAIYKVTSDTTPVFLVPKTYCNTEVIEKSLENMLLSNNYQIEYVDGLLERILSKENHAKYDGIIMADCTRDISCRDSDLLEEFLDNDGKKGKAFVFFAGINTYTNCQELVKFLNDWNIGIESGILYETNPKMHSANDPTSMLLGNRGTDYTPNANKINDAYYAGTNLVPMYELAPGVTSTYVREATVFMSTSTNTVTVMPADKSVSSWKPDSKAEVDVSATGIITEDVNVIDNQFMTSYVVAFASSNIIDPGNSNSSRWKASAVSNMVLTLDIFNSAVGIADAPYTFVPKVITNNHYEASQASAVAMRWIFMAAIPVTLIVGGIVVWVRRRTR